VAGGEVAGDREPDDRAAAVGEVDLAGVEMVEPAAPSDGLAVPVVEPASSGVEGAGPAAGTSSRVDTSAVRSGSGRAAGEPAGKATVDAAGDVAGNAAGDVAGNAARDAAGNAAGDAAGDVAGNAAGDAGRDAAGEAGREVARVKPSPRPRRDG
jgi:hypothetical protein